MSRPSRKPSAAMRLRHALIAQWRGIDAGPIQDLPAKKLGNVLDKVVKDLGLSERMQLEDVLAAWRTAAGDFISRHAKPESVARGILTVRVLQSSVHHALSMEKTRLVAKLNEQLGKSAIKDIRFRHG